MRTTAPLLALALALGSTTLPATAAPFLADARKEIQTEMQQARRELADGDLALGQRISLGSNKASADKSGKERAELPPAVITVDGRLRIDGQEVVTTAAQRALLLDYRRTVIDVAHAGLDVGERAAAVALEAIDRPLLSLLASAFTGSLEDRIERTVLRELAPLAEAVCGRLPAALAAQDRLAGAMAEFRPYARLEADEVHTCRRDIAQSLANR